MVTSLHFSEISGFKVIFKKTKFGQFIEIHSTETKQTNKFVLDWQAEEKKNYRSVDSCISAVLQVRQPKTSVSEPFDSYGFPSVERNVGVCVCDSIGSIRQHVNL